MANDFKKYPYQDFNAFNLDWIIERTKEIDTVNETAVRAIEKANEARYIASAAANTADAANNTANAASTTANAAQGAASTAQTRADSAYTLANTANTAAGNAQSTADSAAGAASAAQTRADNAYTLANTANTTAGNAQSTANSASSAASAAQTRADNAYTLADTANTAAGNAQTDATAALNGLNNLIEYGTWTPTVANANTSQTGAGKWWKIGDIVFLEFHLYFSTSQTNRGVVYINENSLPTPARGKAIAGTGGTGSYGYFIDTGSNSNMWIELPTAGRANATNAAYNGTTPQFTCIALPRT